MRVPRLPRPGETVSGDGFRASHGGKGANQAVAVARAGAAVTFIACVGADAYGRAAHEQLTREGLKLDHLRVDPEQSSGTALILVASDGSNSIAVAGGANHRLGLADVVRAGSAFAAAHALLLQLETPLETVQAAAALAASHGMPVILNPAPARPLPDSLYRLVSVLTPNETEAEHLTGIRVTDPSSAARAADCLLKRGARAIVITLGARGAWIATAAAQCLVPGFNVHAVDTTAAGDVFNGALAVALAEGQPLEQAARFANAAAALAVTKQGAQESAPTRSAIEAFLLANSPSSSPGDGWSEAIGNGTFPAQLICRPSALVESPIRRWMAPTDIGVDLEPDSAVLREFATQYPLEQAHLFTPPWRNHTMYGESVAFLQSDPGRPADGTLLFTPESVLHVRSSDGSIEYELGHDYTVDVARRRLVLPPGSRIPFLTRTELYVPKGSPHSMPHKVGDGETNLLYAERSFPPFQVEVDYTHREPWTGYMPAFAGAQLPQTLAKLRHHEGLTVGVLGDSISAGANASKTIPPFMPAYVALVQRGLEQAYGVDVTPVNLAAPSTTAVQGKDKLAALLAAAPDLVVIAFGMNDTNARDPDGFREQVQSLITSVRTRRPATEFILVSSSRANPEWNWSPAEEFPRYAVALQSLAGPGVAFVDLTAVWTELLSRKRYVDLTGNGINHPNDFGHRLYAQAILSLLVEPPDDSAR